MTVASAISISGWVPRSAHTRKVTRGARAARNMKGRHYRDVVDERAMRVKVGAKEGKPNLKRAMLGPLF